MITKKNKDFCEEYIANGYNGQDAYLKVYYGTDTPTETQRLSCKANACRVLARQEIKDYIEQLLHERFEALHINADRIAIELATIAFGIIGDDCSESGKLKALELLGKQLQLYTQKIEAKLDETIITVSVEEDED